MNKPSSAVKWRVKLQREIVIINCKWIDERREEIDDDEDDLGGFTLGVESEWRCSRRELSLNKWIKSIKLW